MNVFILNIFSVQSNIYVCIYKCAFYWLDLWKTNRDCTLSACLFKSVEARGVCMPPCPSPCPHFSAGQACLHTHLPLGSKCFSLRGRVVTTIPRFRSVFGKLIWVTWLCFLHFQMVKTIKSRERRNVVRLDSELNPWPTLKVFEKIFSTSE